MVSGVLVRVLALQSSQLSNGGYRLTDTECGKQCSLVYWLECWPCKAESAQQWWLEAN